MHRANFRTVLALAALITGYGLMGTPAGFITAQDRSISVGASTAGGGIAGPHSVEFSAIAAIVLPNIGMLWHLSKVQLVGGAGSGSFALLYDGVSKAHFVVSNAGYAEWDVDWPVPGTNIPATSQTTSGTAPARVNLIFTPTSLPGTPPIRAFRAIFITATPGAANATAVAIPAVNFDVAPGIPTGIIAFTSAGNAQIIFPATGGAQEVYECELATITFTPTITFAPQIPSSQSIALSETNSAAATLSIWIFYTPTVAGVQ